MSILVPVVVQLSMFVVSLLFGFMFPWSTAFGLVSDAFPLIYLGIGFAFLWRAFDWRALLIGIVYVPFMLALMVFTARVLMALFD